MTVWADRHKDQAKQNYNRTQQYNTQHQSKNALAWTPTLKKNLTPKYSLLDCTLN